MILACPRALNDRSALAFTAKLPRYVTAADLTIDFAPLRFARPYATLILAEVLRDFVSERASWGLETQVEEEGLFVGELQPAISYLSHVGFFEYIGVGLGNAPGVARGGPTYLPITVVTREQLTPTTPGRMLQDSIVSQTRRLAEMIFWSSAESCVVRF